MEQYTGQVLGKNFADSHAAALVVECKVVAGGGARKDTVKRIGTTNQFDVTTEFQNGIIVTMVLDLDLVVNPTNVTMRRP